MLDAVGNHHAYGRCLPYLDHPVVMAVTDKEDPVDGSAAGHIIPVNGSVVHPVYPAGVPYYQPVVVNDLCSDIVPQQRHCCLAFARNPAEQVAAAIVDTPDACIIMSALMAVR